MDQFLPVAAPYDRDCWPKHWRDIRRSDAVEVAQVGDEPVTIQDVKDHTRIPFIDDDAWLARVIPVARRQVEADMNMWFVLTDLQMRFDQFPIEPAIPLPRPPLVSVAALSWFSYTGVETALVANTDYFVDTDSTPGRVLLMPTAIWPTGVRPQLGGKVTWRAGATTVPARAIHAMLLLIAHYFENREAVTSGGNRYAPELYPLGYEALIGDRVVALG